MHFFLLQIDGTFDLYVSNSIDRNTIPAESVGCGFSFLGVGEKKSDKFVITPV